MEKDSSKAVPPRREALAPKSAPSSRSTASGSATGNGKRGGTAGEPKSVRKAAHKEGKRNSVDEEPRARPRTRLRQPDEPRAQMLERLSNPLISLHEASVLLQVCAATVRRLSNEGELPHKRTEGGQRRFHLNDVMRLSDERDKRRASSSRASARSLARPHAPSLPASALADGSARALEQERLQEVRAEQARVRESRERLASVQARAEQARLAAQKQPGAPAPAGASGTVKPGPAPGEAPRPANPLRLGIARALAPRAREDAASKPRRQEGDE